MNQKAIRDMQKERSELNTIIKKQNEKLAFLEDDLDYDEDLFVDI